MVRYQRAAILVLFGWYLALALGAYFDQRPLWNDEQCVLNNIVELKGPEIFSRPLLSNQDFPRLYLWVIQQFSALFNQDLLALRLFPLMAMVAAFFVWAKIARRVLEDPWDLAAFAGCWCASMPLVYHATELKPYSLDVLASGLIVLFLLCQKVGTDTTFYKKSSVCPYFSLPLLGLFSYPALFLLLLPLYNLVRSCYQQRRWPAELSFFLAGYILVLGFVYFFDFRVSVHHLLEETWHDYFITFDSWKDFFNSLGKGINNLIGRVFAENPRWVKGPCRIFIGLGLVYMFAVSWGNFKKDAMVLRSIVPMALAMVFLQLALAMLRVFPLGVPRLTLFFFPLLILMTLGALKALEKTVRPLGLVLKITFAAYLVFVSLGNSGWDVFIQRDLSAQSTLYARS